MVSKRPITPEETSSAARMADAVNLHIAASLETGRETPGYVAIRMSDGGSPDNTLYDTRRDLFRHHPHDRHIFAIKVGKDSMPLREAIIVLQMHRMAFSRGVIFREEELVTPHLTELVRPLLPRTIRGLGLHLPRSPFHREN